MRGWVMAAAALALAGCAGGQFVGYGPVTLGGQLPATRAVGRGDLVTPPGRGDLSLPVRAFTPGPDGELDEVSGAICRITAGSLEAALATPGRLVIPDLGPDAPPVQAECAAAGRVGAAAVPPVFAWSQSGGNPPQRVLWGLGWWYGGVKSGPLSYPPLSVTLR